MFLFYFFVISNIHPNLFPCLLFFLFFVMQECVLVLHIESLFFYFWSLYKILMFGVDKVAGFFWVIRQQRFVILIWAVCHIHIQLIIR